MDHLLDIGVHPRRTSVRLLRGFTGYAEAFRAASEKLEKAQRNDARRNSSTCQRCHLRTRESEIT